MSENQSTALIEMGTNRSAHRACERQAATDWSKNLRELGIKENSASYKQRPAPHCKCRVDEIMVFLGFLLEVGTLD